MSGLIGKEDGTFSNILTEKVPAQGTDERAIWEWEMTKAMYARDYAGGLCNCGCGRYFWSFGSWQSGHMPDEEVYLREIDRIHAETKPQAKKTTRYELGAREFTLTYSPKWFDDAEARTGMIIAIRKLIKYYKDEIITLRAVGEVGTNGLSHVHCFYKLIGGLKITDKNFKRAWKYWNPKKPLQRGFEGGHHATVRNESDFLGYIDKDIETAWFDKTFTRENINAD